MRKKKKKKLHIHWRDRTILSGYIIPVCVPLFALRLLAVKTLFDFHGMIIVVLFAIHFILRLFYRHFDWRIFFSQVNEPRSSNRNVINWLLLWILVCNIFLGPVGLVLYLDEFLSLLLLLYSFYALCWFSCRAKYDFPILICSVRMHWLILSLYIFFWVYCAS